MLSAREKCDSSVGLRLLNVDHRAIERLIEQLHVAIAFGHPGERTLPLLRQLSDLTRTHFALEEGMMAATGYPDTAAHRRSHQHLQQQLDGFIALCCRGQVLLNPNSLSFLFVWHSIHSHREDARYADWLVLRDARIRQESFAPSTLSRPFA